MDSQGFVLDLDIIRPKVFRKIAAVVEKQVFSPMDDIINENSLNFGSKNRGDKITS